VKAEQVVRKTPADPGVLQLEEGQKPLASIRAVQNGVEIALQSRVSGERKVAQSAHGVEVIGQCSLEPVGRQIQLLCEQASNKVISFRFVFVFVFVSLNGGAIGSNKGWNGMSKNGRENANTMQALSSTRKAFVIVCPITSDSLPKRIIIIPHHPNVDHLSV